MINGFRGFSYGYPWGLGRQYSNPRQEKDRGFGYVVAIGAVIVFVLLAYSTTR